MLETSSRLHTIVYACLLSIVVICGSVQLSAFVASQFDLSGSSNLVVLSAIVTAILAPPTSFLLAIYSHKLIRVQERLHGLATTDPLTGLLNRRAFEDFYNRESARSARKNQPISLLVLDLDYFKNVNNRHGHAGGDVALCALSDCLRKSVRFGSDEVARWGGEEFAIILTDTGRETAIRAALRYRQKVESLDIRFDEKQIHLTASFGIVVCNKGETLKDAVARADLCLRQAKTLGRNKVVAFPASAAAAPKVEAA